MRSGYMQNIFYFVDRLQSIGFNKIDHAESAWGFNGNKNKVYLFSYVDDIFRIVKNIELMSHAKSMLMKEF